MILKNGRILCCDFGFAEKSLTVENDRITAVGGDFSEADIDLGGLTVLPGLVDIHTHGCGEWEGYDGDGAVAKMAEFFAENGTTAFLPTSRGMDFDKLIRVTKEIANFIEGPLGENFAAPLGIHLEGPFLSEAKRGAHPSEYILPPDAELWEKLCEAAHGQVKIISLAPELEGALDFIGGVSDRMTVSVAHSAASYETAKEAFARGATHVTHLFNAMTPFGHREPGIIGAAFDSQSVTAELITDGEHVHPAAVRLAFKALGSDRVVLISDSVTGAGLPTGEYVFRGVPHTCVKGKAVHISDGTLAGGGGFLLDNVRSAVSFGIPLEAAVKAASLNPAKVIGCDRELGSIEAGKRADLIFVDGDLNLKGVMLRGKLLFLNN